MRYPYIPKNIEIVPDQIGTVNVTLAYNLDGTDYEELVPVTIDLNPSAADIRKQIDKACQNRIQNKRDALDRIKQANIALSNFGDLVGQLIDYKTDEELDAAIAGA